MTTLDPLHDLGAATTWWTQVDLNTLETTPTVQPTLGRIDNIGLVYPGLRHVFSGPPESAKTLAAYIISIHVLREGHIVLLIDFEMGAYNARDRLVDLGATPEDLKYLVYVDPDSPATELQLKKLRQEVTPELVVIDASAGAYDLQGLDDNKRQDVGRIYKLYVEPFFRDGIATIFLDHVVKHTESRGHFAIGSERKVGVADVHLGFETIRAISRGTSGLYKIHTHKDRGGFHKRGILAELELTSDPETHRITYELRPAPTTDSEHPFTPTIVMQNISTILQQQTEPISRKHTTDLAGGKRAIALTAIDLLVRLNYVAETNGPRGAKLLTHTRPFTVLDWENQPDPSPVPTCSPPVPGTADLDLFPAPLKGAGRNRSADNGTRPPVPDEQTSWNWVDELTPPNPNQDDNIPF